MGYNSTLHQHHESNLAEILALIGRGVKEEKIKNIYSVKLYATGSVGVFDMDRRKKRKEDELHFESFLPRYSRDGFNKKLVNFFSEVERKCNLGSDYFRIELLSDKNTVIETIELY